MQLSNGRGGGVLSMHMLLPVGDACATVICKAMALTIVEIALQLCICNGMMSVSPHFLNAS